MKLNQMMKDEPDGTIIPELWRMAALMKMCPKEIKHNIELNWDTIDEKYSLMIQKVVMWATNAAEKEGGAVPMDVGTTGRMSRVRVGGCGLPDDEVLLLSWVQPQRRWRRVESKESEKEDPAARARENVTERGKGSERSRKRIWLPGEVQYMREDRVCVDAVTMEEGPWIVGSQGGAREGEVHAGVRWSGCVEDCCVKE